MAKTDRIDIRITPELKAQLQQLAESEGRSISNMIVRLITDALAEKNGK